MQRITMPRRVQRGSATIAFAVLLSAAALGGIYQGAKKYFGLDDNTGTFLWGCVTRPHENGAIAPCSKYVAQEIVKPLERECGRRLAERNELPLRILEVGAGSGVLTREIVKTAELSGLDYSFDVIEINNDYVKKLRKEFEAHDRVNVKCMSILDFTAPNNHYDIIVSTVPFSIFDIADVKKIFSLYQNVIQPGGKFSFIKLRGHRATQKLLQGEQKIQYQEKQIFIEEFNAKYCTQRVEVKRNIPPLYVFHCTISDKVSRNEA